MIRETTAKRKGYKTEFMKILSFLVKYLTYYLLQNLCSSLRRNTDLVEMKELSFTISLPPLIT